MINKYIRKDLLNFKPYHAPCKDYEIKIDANENPYKHSKRVLNGIKEWLDNKENVTRYPDTDSNALREKIANLYNISKENVICGVGSDQLIELIIKLFIEPGDKVLVPNPSFSMYGLSTLLNHGEVIEYELKEDFSYSVNKLINLYNKEYPKLVFLCTPNNPTGSIITKDEIKELLKVIKCPVIIDEAYAEFVTESMIGEIDKYNNIIVLRTFSKAFGLASLRVGYGISCADMINALNICKPPYNLSAFSQKFGELVIDNVDYYTKQVSAIKENRDILVKKLKEVEIIDSVYPSYANFVLLKSSRADRIIKYLEEKKILVRGYGDEGRLRNCIRITVGSEDENNKLVEALKSIEL